MLADVGNHVMCVDIDPKRSTSLKSVAFQVTSRAKEIVANNVKAGRLFTTDVAEGVAFGDYQMIAVAPPGEDGSADLRYVVAAAARNIGRTRRHQNCHRQIHRAGRHGGQGAKRAEELKARGSGISFSVVSNPEFLKKVPPVGLHEAGSSSSVRTTTMRWMPCASSTRRSIAATIV